MDSHEYDAVPLHRHRGPSIGSERIEVPPGPVLKHGPRSLSCARANGRVSLSTKGAENITCLVLRDYGRGSLLVPPSPGVVPGMRGRSGVVRSSCHTAGTVPQHTASAQDVTRKMVNYA